MYFDFDSYFGFDSKESKPKQFVVEGESGVCLADYETQKFFEFFGFEQDTLCYSKDEEDEADEIRYILKILFYPSDGIYDEYELVCTVSATRFQPCPRVPDPFWIYFHRKTTAYKCSNIQIDTSWAQLGKDYDATYFIWTIEETITNIENNFDLIAMPNKFHPPKDCTEEIRKQHSAAFSNAISQYREWLDRRKK